MCCNGHSLAATAHNEKSTHIDEQVVATPLPDGYWLEAFPFSPDAKVPDLIGYGLGFEGKPASVKLFHNPENDGSGGWKVTEIQSLDFPVGMTYADLTGNGYNDIIICDRYGPSMGDLWDAKEDDGGRVIWLENPGDRAAQPYWKMHKVGNSTGMHRLKVGNFTRRDVQQILALPIIPASGDLTSPAPVIVYTPKYGSGSGPESWDVEIPFPSQFRLIHDLKIIKNADTGLDIALVAGREGIVALWFEEEKRKWAYNIVGTGLAKQDGNRYWGSGSVDVVRVGDDPIGYIATCEAFHGNVISVYVKDSSAPKGAASLKDAKHWKRIKIDDFGPLNSEHTGTVHNVVTVDQHHGHHGSFAIACMGAPVGKPENQGVYTYTPNELSKGDFKRIKVTDQSAGRLAVAGFSDSKRMDIASISYYVPGYHTGPDPPSVRIDTVLPYNIVSRTRITATKLDKEVLVRVPRPGTVPHGCTPAMPIVTIAGKKLTVVVLRPGAQMRMKQEDGAKVIWGSIHMKDGANHITRTIACDAKDIATTRIISKDGTVTAGENGAVFLHVEVLTNEYQGPYRSMSQVGVTNVFPSEPEVPAEVRAMDFPFVKVQDLAWASSGLWDDFEFYNMTGFYVYFNDDAMEEICHMQAWTLGVGETARFHNHSDKSFCEIHYCLANGGGSGGMRYFPDDYTKEIDTSAELTKKYVENNSELLVVPDMHEHGPLWKIQPGTKATPQLRPNDTADYPWHAWLASKFGEYELPIKPPLDEDKQRYDLWLAFEFPTSAFQY